MVASSSEIEARLTELRARLKEYEAHARAIPQLKTQIEELEEEYEASTFHNVEGSKKSSNQALPEAPMPAMAQPAAAPEGDAKAKRMKAINKKLQQIAKLKETTGELDADAVAKVRGEAKLLKELDCLKKDIPYEDDGEEPPAHFTALPTDPAEVAKRIKAINKKLEQIAGLKDKEGALDADAKAKIASEHELKTELAALEAGENKAVLKPREKTMDEELQEQQEEKHALERRHKAIKKKLAGIDSLKKQDASTLDADAKSKLASEKDLKKELGSVEKQMGEVNKKERARVEARLG